jgi:hypothetical protein
MPDIGIFSAFAFLRFSPRRWLPAPDCFSRQLPLADDDDSAAAGFFASWLPADFAAFSR